MNGQGVYLDTSSIVKRYVGETGSEVADLAYARAEVGARRIVTSIWNVGEVLGVLDTYRSRKLLTERAFLKALTAFLAESEKMLRLGGMQILPLAADTLMETYTLILKHRIYQADALQVASCKISKSGLLLSADKRLLSAAKAENVEALDMETDAQQIIDRLS